MVEHILAKDKTGVRFSLPAHNVQLPIHSKNAEHSGLGESKAGAGHHVEAVVKRKSNMVGEAGSRALRLLECKARTKDLVTCDHMEDISVL